MAIMDKDLWERCILAATRLHPGGCARAELDASALRIYRFLMRRA